MLKNSKYLLYHRPRIDTIYSICYNDSDYNIANLQKFK